MQLLHLRIMSICLSCVIFTCKDKKVEDNKYIPMFYMWLSTLIERESLSDSDTLYINTDNDTKEYMNTSIVFEGLLEMCPCKIKMVCHPRPENILEGAMLKYKTHEYKEDVFIYCDIDIFITNSLHRITDSLKDNTICVHHEGDITDPNYGAAFSEEDLKEASNLPGFSAGKFMIRGKELYTRLCKTVQTLYESCPNKNYYCLEQPYFNKALYTMAIETIDTELITHENSIISVNGHDYMKHITIFLDCMGEPGNGSLHHDKMLSYFTLFHCGRF